MSVSINGFKQSVIQDIRKECVKQGLIMREQQAYILATVEHETAGTFQPVREAYYLGSRAENFRRSLRYYPFYGRGYVQLTWRANYAKYRDLLHVDLVAHPDLALRPDIARFILVHGFKTGAFTGKSIDDYIRPGHVDYENARRCINGVDRAGHIAGLTRHFL